MTDTVKVTTPIPPREPVLSANEPSLKVNDVLDIKNESFQQTTFATNVVKLPSKGLLYEENDPLSQGYVEMKFMTAKEENILTTESYIKSGIVIDKLLQSMIIAPKFNIDNLLIGDKDALLIAARVYGYGEMYNATVTTPSGRTQKVEINLEELPHKELDESLFASHTNRFSWTFTNRLGQYTIEFKLLTSGDLKEIDGKLKKYKTANSVDTQITSRLQQLILSVNGNPDPNYIRMFVENEFLAPDARKFREYVASIQPGVNMEIDVVDEESGDSFRTQIALGSDLLWSDVRV